MNEARIKLAEAMGWTCHEIDMPKGFVWMPPDFGDHYSIRDSVIAPCLPDPFTYADDDFAVLEWMRKRCGEVETPEWRAFKDTMLEWGTSHLWNYQTGNIARAACKVLEID